jgi:hypothetical protein
MKNLLLALVTVVSLTGCATVERWIPSFWDDNQSARIVDARLKIDRIDCARDQLTQAGAIRDDLRWFELYSDSKGRLQKDVIQLIKPMQETTEDWYKRSLDGQGSKTYCEIKKKLLQQQSERAARGILGRW